jgi:tRNA (guanine37-N1)-methyltransferase
VRVDVVSIFPDYLRPLDLSLLGRAQRDGLLEVRVHDLRRWTSDRHRTVDDTPYGGGPGMLMRPEPWGDALDELVPRADGPADGSAQARGGPDGPLLVVPSPGGLPFSQALAHELAEEPWLLFACARYEGLDQRVLDEAADRMRVLEVSLGDYVLNGGEVAVLAVVEAVARLLPGVVGNAASLVDESYADGLLEAPAYTKPAEWRGRRVPDVLLSGDHGAVARWRRDEALRRTALRRPDLLAGVAGGLDEHDRAVLREAGWPGGDAG